MGGDGFVTTSSRFLLPFAPEDTRLWTEEIYHIYDLVQVAVGLRKELTEEELKIKEIEELGEAGNPDWLEKMKELFGNDDTTFEALVGDEDVIHQITKSLDAEDYEYE